MSAADCVKGDPRYERCGCLTCRTERLAEDRAPNLWPVILWLEGGCDPKWAAKELRAYAARLGQAEPSHTPGVPVSEPLRHSTKDNGDCPHWCKACAAEERERNAGVAVTSPTADPQRNEGGA